MKLIKLTQGQFAMIDDDEYDKVIKHKWHAAKHKQEFYAATVLKACGGWVKRTYLHHFILEFCEPGMFVDHIDNNPLNNQKSNLRVCTPRENSSNRRSSRKSHSKYLGVSYCHYKKKSKINGVQVLAYYQVMIGTTFLGRFPDTPDGEIAAAKTYDKAAKERFGEFANLNFPE